MSNACFAVKVLQSLRAKEISSRKCYQENAAKLGACFVLSAAYQQQLCRSKQHPDFSAVDLLIAHWWQLTLIPHCVTRDQPAQPLTEYVRHSLLECHIQFCEAQNAHKRAYS